MATVLPRRIWHPLDGEADLFEWLNFSNGDVIGWLVLPQKADKTLHMYGTFGGTVTLDGSLESGTPSNPFTINDSRGEGNPLSFTANDGRTLMENVLQIRPNPGAGVTNTTLRILCVRGGG